MGKNSKLNEYLPNEELLGIAISLHQVTTTTTENINI
jgi:hypothetical protein